MLRSKVYAEKDIPVEECLIDDPTLLEQLHFLVTCLPREALRRRRNVVCQADTRMSNLSEYQQALVRSCQKRLEADYERRKQHMRQRFEILKASFPDAATADLVLDVTLPTGEPSSWSSELVVDPTQFWKPSTVAGDNMQLGTMRYP
jgi:hypothetical protein